MKQADIDIISILTTIRDGGGAGGSETLTGDVTGTGSGTIVTTIGAGKVTDAKLGLTTPALGTPASLVGTNITGTAAGLTAGTASAVAVGGITGLGTGVATALAVNVGSAGAPVVLNGAGGTPSSLVGTNITGTAAGLTAGAVTTNANLTGHVTSVGNAAVLGSFTLAQLNTAVSDADIARTDAANTFTGTQTIGALVATTVNGNTITTGTSIFTGTAGATYTFPSTTANIQNLGGSLMFRSGNYLV